MAALIDVPLKSNANELKAFLALLPNRAIVIDAHAVIGSFQTQKM